MLQIMSPGLYFSLWDSVREFVCDACVWEECVPSFPFSRLFGCSVFGNSLGCVDDADGANIQEILSMGGSLMWNDSTVWGGRMELKCLRGTDVKYWSPLIVSPQWCSRFPWYVGNIGTPCYWRVSNPTIARPCHGLPCLLGWDMLCASTQGHWIYL